MERPTRLVMYACGAILLGSVGCGSNSGKQSAPDGGSQDASPDTSADRTGTVADTRAADSNIAETSGGSSGSNLMNGQSAEWPSWEQFSPPLPSGTKRLSDETDAGDELKAEPVSGDAGVIEYDCVYKKYSITETPDNIVMFGNPDRDLLWPGAFIQGKTLRDGTGVGSLGTLVVDGRAPIRVRIPNLMNNDNTRLVENPTGASVEQAIGSMISGAAQLATPSAISYTKEESSSTDEFALNAKLSARYLGFKMSASAGVSRKANEHTVIAHFYESMFEALVEHPSTPGGWFTERFTADMYNEQVKLGRIGPHNLPVYVSKVVYGRMLIFSMTSTASALEIQAALEASYKGLSGEGSVEIDGKVQKTLSESKVELITVGGDAEAALGAIKSGNLQQYFDKSAPLTSAVPIAYIFRNMGDDSIAKVSETTTYTVKECTADTSTTDATKFDDPISGCNPAKVWKDKNSGVDHAYFVCPAANWVAGSDFCNRHAAHLATITSQDESIYLQGVQTPVSWIGGRAQSACNQKASFAWENREASTFSNWYSNQPDSAAECCMVLNDGAVGSWGTYLCTVSHPIICERETGTVSSDAGVDR